MYTKDIITFSIGPKYAVGSGGAFDNEIKSKRKRQGMQRVETCVGMRHLNGPIKNDRPNIKAGDERAHTYNRQIHAGFPKQG